MVRSARLVLGVALLSPPAAAAQSPPLPEAEARRISLPPRIDGRLDDAAWQAVPPITGFRLSFA